MTDKSDDDGGSLDERTDVDVVRLQQGIEQTRSDMSVTLAELETKLNPSELRDKVGAELAHVEDRVRAVVHEQLTEAKELVKTELAEAKTLLRGEMDEAEKKLRKGLTDAKAAFKEDVSQAWTGAKQAVRASTVGKVEDLATNIGDKMNQTRDTLIDTVRNNPVPAALTGIGLVWLLMNRSKTAARKQHGFHDSNVYGGGSGNLVDQARGALGRVGTGVSDAAHSVTDAAHSVTDATGKGIKTAADAASNAVHGASDATVALAHRAGDAASHLAAQAGDAASSVADGAKKQAQRLEQGVESTFQENPVAVGAAVLALGAIVGYSLPRSDREDSLMGQARDRVLTQAGDVAQGAASSLANLAQHAVEGAKQLAEEQQISSK